jgi:hypothetical protein
MPATQRNNISNGLLVIKQTAKIKKPQNDFSVVSNITG